MTRCAYKDVVVMCAEDAYEKGMDLPFIAVGMRIDMDRTTTYVVRDIVVQGNANTIVLHCRKVEPFI